MIDDLSYLNAVVMECLRVVDTISSYQTRTVPKGGCKLSGYYIPADVGNPPFTYIEAPNLFSMLKPRI